MRRNGKRVSFARSPARGARVRRSGGHASTRRRSRSRRRNLVHGAAHGPARMAEPEDGPVATDRARPGLRPPWRRRRSGRRTVDHRRWPYAIVRVDPRTRKVRRFQLPSNTGYANLNTATFDRRGVLWFTGQSGIYGRLDPKLGRVRVFSAPRGEGPYGITATPAGEVYYASLAGSYLGRIDVRSGKATSARTPSSGSIL
jgi:hypothetical protein